MEPDNEQNSEPIPVHRTLSESSLPSLFSNLLSKRSAPSNLKIQHRPKAGKEPSILTLPRIMRLIVTFGCFIEIGITTSLTGVLLIDLKEALGFLRENKSLIIVNLSAGDVFGTLIGGYLADRVRAEKLSSANLMITALAGFALNCSDNHWIILVCFVTFGFTNAFLEIVMEVWIINLWAGYGGKITHMAYFFYGLGTLISPALVAPFLDEQFTPNGTAIVGPRDLTRVFIPYAIVAIYCLFLSIFLIIISCTEEVKKDHSDGVTYRIPPTNNTLGVKWSIMILFFLLTQSISGLDCAFGLLLMNFAVSSANTFTKHEGVQLTAAYWVTYTFTRIITMVLMSYIHDRELMWGHLGITGVGVLLLWVKYPKELFIWISTIIIGAGVSPTSPLVLSYFNSYIKVTGKIATIFMLADCFGEFIYPTLMDYTLNQNPLSFVYGTAFTVFSSMVYLIFLNRLLKQRQFEMGRDMKRSEKDVDP